MHDHDYRHRRRDARRRAAATPSADPTAYERANYIGNITTYTSRFLGAQPIHLRK